VANVQKYVEYALTLLKKELLCDSCYFKKVFKNLLFHDFSGILIHSMAELPVVL